MNAVEARRLEIAARNARCLAEWYAKRLAQTPLPDAHGSAHRVLVDRYYRVRRSLARDWVTLPAFLKRQAG